MGAATHGHEGLNMTTIARRFGCSQRAISDKSRKLAEQRERERQQRGVVAA
jgi:hypothetical protein